MSDEGKNYSDDMTLEEYDSIKKIPIMNLEESQRERGIQELKRQLEIKFGDRKGIKRNEPEVAPRPSQEHNLELPSFMDKSKQQENKLKESESSIPQKIKLKIAERVANFMTGKIQNGVQSYMFPWQHGNEGDYIVMYDLGKLQEELEARKSRNDIMPEIPIKGLNYKGMGLFVSMLCGKDNKTKDISYNLGTINYRDTYSGKAIDDMDRHVGNYFNREYSDFDQLKGDSVGIKSFGILEPKKFAMDMGGKEYFGMQRIDKQKGLER